MSGGRTKCINAEQCRQSCDSSEVFCSEFCRDVINAKRRSIALIPLEMDGSNARPPLFEPSAAADPKMPETGVVDVQAAIAEECNAIREMLLEKNRAYGNSALDPLRIFSKADPEEQIRVRIDDKLSRLARGSSAGEDVELDLVGYLVLLRVARRLHTATRVAVP